MSGAEPELNPVRPGLFVRALDGSARARPGDRLHLVLDRCDSCDRSNFPATGTCPRCLGEMATVTVDEGEIGLWTTVLHAPPDALVETPYHVGMIDFPTCNIRISGLLVAPDGYEPAIGDTVSVKAFGLGDGRVTYAFDTDRGAAASEEQR